METFIAAGQMLLREPIALGMALVAVVCAMVAIGRGIRARDRMLTATLALISGMTAWMMASRWEWPR